MAYTAWSVVFGEQPTAAKWNQLGENDAGFKDGTNIDNSAILNRHFPDGEIEATKLNEAFMRGNRRNHSANEEVLGARVQWGWLHLQGNGTGRLSGSVVFPEPFSTNPVVISGFLGADTSGAPASTDSGITEFTNAVASATSFGTFSTSITTTGFDVTQLREGGTFSATNFYGTSWIAIGGA